MPRAHRHDRLPEDELWPKDSRADIDPADQAAHMRRLRDAQNGIAEGYAARDELMLAWATSNALSRRDMATATGLAESRVNQIIRELAERYQQRRNEAGAARVARHMPLGTRSSPRDAR
ncbi:MAG: hypothetical protein ACRDLS_02040 [Solirubrobacteraceae bacterium]